MSDVLVKYNNFSHACRLVADAYNAPQGKTDAMQARLHVQHRIGSKTDEHAETAYATPSNATAAAQANVRYKHKEGTIYKLTSTAQA
jgi:hypothetical protein